jgi:hypothetical protein
MMRQVNITGEGKNWKRKKQKLFDEVINIELQLLGDFFIRYTEIKNTYLSKSMIWETNTFINAIIVNTFIFNFTT